MQTSRNAYGLYLDLPGSVAQWRPRAEAALKAEGFGILTEIDVQATIRAKLGKEVPAQLILGACNPPIAHSVMTAEPDIGLLLPCNVTLRELAGGKTRVGVMDVNGMLAMTGNAALAPFAGEIGQRLARVLAALGAEA